MLRVALVTLCLFCITDPTFAIVEWAEFQSTLTSEKNTSPATRCSTVTTHTGFTSPPMVTELEDCGISSASQHSVQDSGDLRLYDSARSEYGWTSILFSRRFPLPLGGIERRRDGVGIVSSIELFPWDNGAAEGSASMSLVERLPAPNGDLGPAILTLDISGEGLNHFATASVNVFDHDTDELLLSWVQNGEPLVPNNGLWFSQELDFDERVGHAIRFQFEVDGRTVGPSTRLAAAVFLNVPEPGSFVLTMPSLLALGTLRQKRRRMFVSRPCRARSASAPY